MKTIKLLLVALVVTAFTQVQAQTADEIVNNYLEAIGGKEQLSKIKSIKMLGTINAQGMEIPIEMVNTSNGSAYVQIEFQGQKMKQLVSNGTKAWTMNMMAQKMEEIPSDMSKIMIEEFKDFPNPFINYNEKGYKIELIGEETQEGTACYKVKLAKPNMTIDGEEVQNVSFYYFDTENFVPIMVESEVPAGPAKGQIMKTPLSDYQEVDGVYFPFSTVAQGMPMTYSKIEINPVVDAKAFEVAEEKPAPTEDKKN
ncbi:MAG: outer membrane lipoprotein-sorting protein [Bacteroidetes bacterium]|nr:MAG: outer membrane lipoprotein-sorting protein [Bacteroidota bacterium]